MGNNQSPGKGARCSLMLTRVFLCLLGVAFCLGLGTPLRVLASGFAFREFDVPNGTVATPTGINNSGQVAGWFWLNEPGTYSPYPNLFVLSLLDGSFTIIHPPSMVLAPTGFNDSGQIVGNADEAAKHPGFLASDGNVTLTYIGTQTRFNGINNAGDIVGSYRDIDSTTYVQSDHGLLVSGGGQITLDVPGAVNTYGRLINNAGQIAGTFLDAEGKTHGFVYADGVYTPFDLPGNISLVGMNDAGQIAGTFYGFADGKNHGFVLSGGSLTTIDPPGSIGTAVGGINNAGQIAGIFRDASNRPHGFVFSDGGFTSFDPPGTGFPTVAGINDAGQIAGTFTDASGSHGFVATPLADVVWTDAVNATVSGNSIVKSGGCDGCGDAGAVSRQELDAGNGYVQFTASDTAPFRAIGLSGGSCPSDPAGTEFAIGLQDGVATVWECGGYRADTKFAAGDVFTIAVQSGVVQYYKNGTLFYTSSGAVSYPLVAAVGLYSLNSSITDALIGGTSVSLTSASSSGGSSSSGSSSTPPTAGTPQDVVWTDAVNATVSGNSIVKSGGCDGCGDAGALSQQQLDAGDGYVQFTASETAPMRALGLSGGSCPSDPSGTEFAIGLQDGVATVWECGGYRADTTFVTGDVFAIAVQSGVVGYYKNGTLFYTSSGAVSYPLVVTAGLYSLDSSINDAVIAGTSVSLASDSSSGSSSGSSSTTLAGGAPQDVVWTDAVNATVSGNSIVKSGGCDGCGDAGGVAQQQLGSGDGYVQFTASETGPFRSLGLSGGSCPTDPTQPEFAIGLQDGVATVWECWGYRADTTFVTGDVFTIAVQSGVVQYYKNGTLFYTSSGAVSYPLVVKAGLYSLNSSITDAMIAGGQ